MTEFIFDYDRIGYDVNVGEKGTRMNMRSMWILAAMGVIMTSAGSALAKARPAETNLVAALTKAEAEKKLLFVQYGREACGNCKALKGMIQKGVVRLSESDFVYADVTCDDPVTTKAFYARFKIEGRTLPFVVITDPAGKQLAARTGWGEAAEFTSFIKGTKRAYDREQKALLAPSKTLVLALPKPQSSGITPDENRKTRSWRAANGEQVKAAVIEEKAGIVFLEKEDESKIQIRRLMLSKEDQDYLDQLRQDESETVEK